MVASPTKLITMALTTKTKEITSLQYAKYLGCTSQNISKHVRNNNLKFLPDVIEVKNYSRFYLLVVPVNLTIPD